MATWIHTTTRQKKEFNITTNQDCPNVCHDDRNVKIIIIIILIVMIIIIIIIIIIEII